MARINIIQPSYGRITVTDESESHYTVVYTATGAESFFNGFKVYCHACGRYVFLGASADQAATINFTALQSDGHPGPFDISANEREIEFLVETFSNDESMGTTTPVEKIMGVDLGGSVAFTITATAKTGYMFVKWVSVTTGKEYTSSSQHITVHVNYVTDNYRAYIAYFAPKAYDATCRGQYAGNPSSGSPRLLSMTLSGDNLSTYLRLRVRQIEPGVYEEVNVAVISRDATRIASGGKITFTVQMLPAAETYGVVFLEWVASTYAVERGMHGIGSTFTVTGNFSGSTSNSRRVVDAWFGFGADWHAVTVLFRNAAYLQPSTPLVPVSARLWDGVSDSSEVASMSGYSVAEARYSWRFRGSSPLCLYVYWTGPLEPMAVVHGTSSPYCEIGQWSVPGRGDVAAFRITIGESTREEFVVYLCTHHLVCTDDGAHLECNPPELLYDCSVPPGTTVYD